MVTDVVSGGSDSSAAFLTIFTSGRWGRRAVSASVNGSQFVLQVVGSVLHARSADETSGVGVGVDATGVTSIARATSLGVDDDLSVDGDGGNSLQLVKDVKSISNGGGRSLSPARPAVLGNVLVLVPGEVVNSVHVSPVDFGGNVSGTEFFPSVSGGLDSTLDVERGAFDTASLLGGLQEVFLDDFTGLGRSSRLGEFVDFLVVSGVVLLSLSGLVELLGSPGVLGGDPRAVLLNGDVVCTSFDLGETLVTPVRSPGVSHEPVLLAVLDTVSDDGDGVDLLLVSGSIGVDSLSAEGLERIRDGDSTGDRSASGDLLHHVLLSLNITVLIGVVSLVSIGDEAGFSGVAVSAVLHGGALLSVVVTSSLVDRASSVGDLVLGHPLEGGEVVSTVASIHVGLARDQNLGRDVDIGPRSFTGDLDAVGEDGGGGMSPARSTVLGDVLVPDVSQEVCSVSVGLDNVVPKDLSGEIGGVEERLTDVLNNSDQGLNEVRVFTVNVEAGVGHDTEHSYGSEGFHLKRFCY